MSEALSPSQLAAEAQGRIAAAADSAVARQAHRFFKPSEAVPLHGVATPVLRRIEKDLFRQVKESWGYAEAVDFCERLLQKGLLEEKILGLLLLARFRDRFDRSLLSYAATWLATDLCASWAVTDVLAQHVVAPLLERHPDLTEHLAQWSRSDNRWMRRACAVALVREIASGRHVNFAYATVETILDRSDDLVEKAAGWLLREAGRRDPKRLERYLRDNGSHLPRTTVRYALELFPQDRRKALLVATRPSRGMRGGARRRE